MRAFVTGGTGFLGLHLIETLATRGINTSCLVRNDLAARKPRILHYLIQHKIDLKYGDLRSSTDLRNALDDTYDYVFHLAGVVSSTDRDDYRTVNVDGTKNLLHAVQRVRNLKRLVHMSSISAAGPIQSSEPLTETVHPKPKTPYEISKYEAEQLVSEFGKETGIPATIVRAPMIYGYGEHSGILTFAKLAARGLVPVVSERAALPLVYARNLADGLLLCAENSSLSIDNYILADARTYTLTEITEHIAHILKVAPIHLRIPMSLLNVAATRFRYLAYAANNVRLSIDKAVTQLGYKPRDCWKQGLKETVRYHVANRLLSVRNYPLSPLETMRTALSEQEGLGSAYEYYVKSRILTHQLGKEIRPESALILSFPRKHESTADIAATLNELGVSVRTIKVSKAEDLVPKGRFDVIVAVADSFENVEEIVSMFRPHSGVIILFANNAENVSHFEGWAGTPMRRILKAHPISYCYLDCPPFPSGLKVFAGRNPKETRLLRTIMLGLVLWSKLEGRVPMSVKGRFSHMTSAVYGSI